MSDRKVRMGIDVGGTHTKAVAIDNATHEIIGKSSVKTTHDDKAGVATGVVQAFQNCLRENGIVVVKHFCNTLFENSPGISSFKWCFPIIVGMRTDMIVPYVHISV